MNLEELASLLVKMGCPAEKSMLLASQLEKRAAQLAEAKGKSLDEARLHLLSLMRQGWAAKKS